MNVTREDMFSIGTLDGLRKVRERDIAIFGVGKGFIVHSKSPVFRGIAGAIVVVASDEQDVERGVLGSPRSDGLKGARAARRPRVEQIAQNHQSIGRERLNGLIQTGEVRGGALFRHGHARVAKRRGLAQMHVRDQQRAPTRPVRHAERREREQLTCPMDVGVLRVGHGVRAF